MKKIILSLCIAILSAITAVPYSYALSSPLPQNRETITERAYRTWLGRIDSDQKIVRITTLKQRLQSASNKAKEQRIQELLTHIETLANESLTTLSHSTKKQTQKIPEKRQKPSQQPHFAQYKYIVDNYDDGTHIYQGGDKGAIMGRYEIIAKREPFFVNEITITSNRSFDSTISNIMVFDEQGTILGSGQPSGNTLKIRGIDYVLQQGSTDFYILADLHEMGYGNVGNGITNLNLALQITDSRGYYSDSKRTTGSYQGDSVVITPIKITQYGFVRSFKGHTVDPYLTENTQSTLGILTFTAGENNNTQATQPTETEALLQQITISVNNNLNNAEKSQFLESLVLDRLDSQTSIATRGSVQGDTVTFNIAQTSQAFARIQQNEQAGYRIRGTLPQTQGRTSIKLSVQNLGNGGVVYSEATTPGVMTMLDGGTYEISGSRLYER